jgi:hypothetical protein
MLIGKNDDSETLIHHCKNNVCGKPVDLVESLLEVIKKEMLR